MLLALLAVIVLVGVFLIAMYNSLVQLRVRSESAWSDIDVQLKRRHDLIPNLVETVKGYAKEETTVFTNIANARSALIGARRLSSDACVVVNAGTAMTVDALTAKGEFIGGIIVPGFDLMHEALAANTARLSSQRGDFSAFPRNTRDAITSGAIQASCGAVERMRGAMLAAHGERAPTGEKVAVVAVSASELGPDGAIARIAGPSAEAVAHRVQAMLAPLVASLGDDPFARKW